MKENGHLKISHSSVVPENDPTLLFINSGMASIKNYFLGNEVPKKPRLVNFQPCIRTKDIDDVGDRHHLTFFEMLGSWSIGDYYKDHACELAYHFLIDELGFSLERLYFTVYSGNEKLGISPDLESVAAWRKCGVPEERIIMLGDDNFWGPAGEIGPCGPCTEVFFDTGEEFGPSYVKGESFDDVNRYIEIWNAGVFMELDKKKDGSFTSLPFKSVDTGAGLERLEMVLNKYHSVYETSLISPLMNLSKELLKIDDISVIRMISDHIRASVMILAEGITPANEGQGYIPRKLIRKCIAACISRGISKPDFTLIVEKVIEMLKSYYPQLKSARETIIYIIKEEVCDFTGIVKMTVNYIDTKLVNTIKDNVLSGQDAFELVTTHGLPKDILDMFVKDRKWLIDEVSYNNCMDEHRITSRAFFSKDTEINKNKNKIDKEFLSEEATLFNGYEQEEGSTQIKKIYLENVGVKNTVEKGDKIYFSTERTPFYAESGGQAGDIGNAFSSEGKINILDTIKIKGTHVHVGEVTGGKLSVGEVIEMKVNYKNKLLCKSNHSATHLLHAALRQVVGKHAIQKGSSVTSERLRFDFQSTKATSVEELCKIERIVNYWIRENKERKTNICSYSDAIDSGAIALFGEKYDSEVRVVSFRGESVELCGGTHVERTGDIGFFLIVSESSVGKGVRRIEAFTGEKAILLTQSRARCFKGVLDELQVTPEETLPKIKSLKLDLKNQTKSSINNSMKEVTYLEECTFKICGIEVFAGILDAQAKMVKSIGDRVINERKYQLVCLLGKEENSLKLFIWSHEKINKKIKASDILKNILEPNGGRGGGRPHFAQGGIPKIDMAKDILLYIKNEFKDWMTLNYSLRSKK